MHRAVKDLPILGDWIYREIESLISESDHRSKVKRIEGMCVTVIKELKSQELSDTDSSFLPDHGPSIQNRIEDKTLRDRNVWVG